MPSLQAMMMNQIFQMMRKNQDPDAKPDYARERQEGADRKPPRTPEGVSVSGVEFGGIHGEMILPEKQNGKTIWYIHGGGFTTGSARERRYITLYLAEKYGFTVMANDYRLAPENKWPAGLEDCMAFYEGMLSVGVKPEKLYVMGESAGGTLALSVVLRLRDEGKPLPMGIAAFSPCTDQTLKGLPSHRKNIDTDYMLGDTISRPAQYEAVFGQAAPEEELLSSPYVSPYYGDYTGLPPVFLSASDTETLYDDAVVLYEKLKRKGKIVKLDVAHGLFHAYPMIPAVPEAQKTIRKAVDFLCGSDLQK